VRFFILAVLLYSCTTNYNINGTMNKVLIVPDADAKILTDIHNVPNNSSSESIKKIEGSVLDMVDNNTEVTQTTETKIIKGDDKSKMENESKEIEVDTDIEVKDKNGKN